MLTPSSGSGYISEIKVSLNKQDERKLLNGYQKIDVNLNKGAGGEEVYIWYKRSYSSALITRIQLSFKEEMWKGLKEAYYTKVDKNLNQGAEGNTINLWFYKGRSEHDVPIEDISITTSPDEEEKMFELSWERLACNLNRRAGGNNIHLWVKRARPTYICDLAATEGFDKDAEMFNKGYIRVDEDTNRGTRGDYVFIWYRLTTSRDTAIRDMQVSITKEEYEGFRKAGYKLVDQDLNQETTGTPVYLWYRKDQPITNFSLMVKETDLEKYKNVIQLIKKNLNEGNDGCTEYLWYYRKEEPLRSRAITDIAVSFNEEEERDLLLQGFIAVPHSLYNDERGNQVYLWYKIGSEIKKLIEDGYIQEKENLTNVPGKELYMCYRLTTDKENGLRDLKLTKSQEEHDVYKSLNYQAVEVEGGEAGTVLWSSKDKGDEVIRSFVVAKNPEDQKLYEKNKHVLSMGSDAASVYLMKWHGDMSAD
ncbi:uncharacterized protein V3H82_014857 [Fundulus diaphanus]